MSEEVLGYEKDKDVGSACGVFAGGVGPMGAAGLIRFANVTDFDAIIMDSDPDAAMASALEGTGVSLTLA